MSDPIQSHPQHFMAGKTKPYLTGALKESDGTTAVDITGWTITLKMNRPDTASPQLLEKTAVHTDDANGLFQFEWVATDLVAGDNQLCVVEYLDTGADTEPSESFYIDVRRAPA